MRPISSARNFVDRLIGLQKAKKSIALLGVDPQLDGQGQSGLPRGFSFERFCCETVEACAEHVVGIKLQLAFFEARGVEGMKTLATVIKLGRKLDLLTVADAKRGDIGLVSAAYADAYLGDKEFGCDAITVNPYLGSDSLIPFIDRVKRGRAVFICVKTSNQSSSEFQDLRDNGTRVWEHVAMRINELSEGFVSTCGLSPIGAVVGATFPHEASRARELMPNAILLVPGYGAQGGSANDAVAGARADGTGVLVNASRALMYAWRERPGVSASQAAADAAKKMRQELNEALETQKAISQNVNLATSAA